MDRKKAGRTTACSKQSTRQKDRAHREKAKTGRRRSWQLYAGARKSQERTKVPAQSMNTWLGVPRVFRDAYIRRLVPCMCAQATQQPAKGSDCSSNEATAPTVCLAERATWPLAHMPLARPLDRSFTLTRYPVRLSSQLQPTATEVEIALDEVREPMIQQTATELENNLGTMREPMTPPPMTSGEADDAAARGKAPVRKTAARARRTRFRRAACQPRGARAHRSRGSSLVLVLSVVEGAYSQVIAKGVCALNESWASALAAMMQLSTMVRAMYPALMLCRLT
jgi:hypothetical protein